jgi:ribosome-associated translation inhibitor RaiA
VVEAVLGRFEDRITRVEVHLSDENSRSKSHGDDMRCVMEARLAGLAPITVTEQAATVEQAVGGAADKLEKSIDRTLERLHDPKGRSSYGGDQTI